MAETQNTPHPANGSAAVIIGRWQIFHKGHETLLDAALATAEHVIVVIGSAYCARDVRNPFNWQEREAMIRSCLAPDELARVKFLNIRDYYNDESWNSAVLEGVHQLTGGGATTLVGFMKDHTSYYQTNFPNWARKEVRQAFSIDATSLRNVFFEGKDPDARIEVLRPYVSTAVLNYLQAWARLPVYGERVKEHLAVVAYRKRWDADVYLTADAVLCAAGHVLLVRRGGEVGYGLWAIPGGFLNPGERFYSGALRELYEETGFRTLESTMKAAFKGSQVFDHPARSARGRLITNAFFFDLGNVRLPEVKGADDALEAKWVPIEDLPTFESILFEDHATILGAFVGAWHR
jgi:bifunctional NMN adenylyltransferase/nudix hydrolase